MIDAELWRAKVQVIAGFASGPGVMIDDEDERDARIVSLLSLLDIEYEATPNKVSRGASITSIHGGEIHASNTSLNWPEMIDQLRKQRGVSIRLLYDRMHTAVVTAGRTRKKYPDVTTMTEARGEAGLLILTVD